MDWVSFSKEEDTEVQAVNSSHFQLNKNVSGEPADTSGPACARLPSWPLRGNQEAPMHALLTLLKVK